MTPANRVDMTNLGCRSELGPTRTSRWPGASAIARASGRDLADEVAGLQDDLDAARRALGQMIKNTATHERN
jgi:hypothetical protein